MAQEWLPGLKKPTKNQYMIEDDQVIVRLTQGKTMTIDVEHINILRIHTFCAHKSKNTFYAHTYFDKGTVSFHRILGEKIFDLAEGLQIDHINHNGLDNRKINLQPKTNTENQRNRLVHKNNQTGVNGVTIRFEKGRKYYTASICRGNEKRIFKKVSAEKHGDEKAFAVVCAWRKYHADQLGYING